MKIKSISERRKWNDTCKGFLVGTGIGLFMCLLVQLFTGCSTVNGLSREDTELVAANSRNLGRLESTVSSLERTVESSTERLEIVTRASERIKDSGERLDYLFNEYEREVDRLLDEIDSLRAREEAYKEAEEREHVNKHNVLGPAGFVYRAESAEDNSVLNNKE